MQDFTLTGAKRFVRSSPRRKVEYLVEIWSQIRRHQRTRRWRALTNAGQIVVCSSHKETYLLPVTTDDLYEQLFVYGEVEFGKLKTVCEIMATERIGVLVDVGANIGHVVIPALARGTVTQGYALEPDPFNFGLCAVNARINQVHKRLTMINAAATDGLTQTVSLAISEVEFGDHRVSELSGAIQDRQVIQVPAVSLNEVVPYLDPQSDLIWIDVQGYEENVLRGSSRHLENGVPICMEFWPEGLTPNGVTADSLLQLLKPYKWMVNLDEPAHRRHPIVALRDLWETLLNGSYGRGFVDVLLLK